MTPENKVPKFIKGFSKENSQKERSSVVTTIQEQKNKKNEWVAEQNVRIKGKESVEIDLENLRKEIKAYNSAGFLNKIKNYFKYKSITAQLEEKAGTLNILKGKIDQAELTKPEFIEVKKLLNDFYRGEKEKWGKSDYTPEDIEENFSEEHLAGLSTDEYALLMRRFPGEMVTHVTRQGIRDHASSFWHTAGEGAFSNGFKNILESKSLRSSLGIALQEHSKEEAVAKFLHLDSLDDLLPESKNLSRRDKALMMFENSFESNKATKNAFADRSAVHLASENVMNEMYGSERGNEIFIAYPSAYVASQLNYGGKGTLADTGGDQHNDKWIYTKEHKGMPIDTGLVFIPKDARVDPRNGSRYEIGPDNNPIKNESAYKGLEQLTTSKEFITIIEKIKEKTGTIDKLPPTSTWESLLKKESEGYTYVPHKETIKELIPVRDDLIKLTGITDDRILNKILNYNNAGNFKIAIARTSENEKNRDIQKAIEEILKQSGTYFIEARNTISSEEYWNQYFAEHPDKKPSKTVFYSGGDPSGALNEWRKKNRIGKQTKDSTYGFSKHKVSDDSIEANEGKNRLASLARKIIDDRFPEPPVIQTELPVETDYWSDEPPLPLD